MAAGLGFKTFSTGDVLTAGDTNGYLMQGIWVFADAAARTAAVASPQEGNMSYLKDTNSTEYYSGSAWVAISGGASGGMTLINTGGTALTGATVTISSIPGTYKHLFVSFNAMLNASAAEATYMRLNGDTGNNYNAGYIRNIGGTVTGQGGATTSAFEIMSRTQSSTARYSSNGGIWILNYTNNGVVGVTFATNGVDGTSPVNNIGSCAYDNSAAITELSFYNSGSVNFSSGTVYVYGVN